MYKWRKVLSTIYSLRSTLFAFLLYFVYWPREKICYLKTFNLIRHFRRCTLSRLIHYLAYIIYDGEESWNLINQSISFVQQVLYKQATKYFFEKYCFLVFSNTWNRKFLAYQFWLTLSSIIPNLNPLCRISSGDLSNISLPTGCWVVQCSVLCEEGEALPFMTRLTVQRIICC